MKRSTHRILTTHCGSLPRPNDLLEMLMAREQGSLHDMPAFHARVRDAYLQIALKEPERVKLIDTSGPVERTQERVREIIVPYLQSRGHLAMNYVR